MRCPFICVGARRLATGALICSATASRAPLGGSTARFITGAGADLSSVNATIRKVTSLKDLSDDELLALATSAANEQAVELDAPDVVH